MSSLLPVVAVVRQPEEVKEQVRVDVAGLLTALEVVPDPRKRRGTRYRLSSVLGLAVFAVSCGAATFKVLGETVADLDGAVVAGFGLRARPSEATFRRVLDEVDPVVLDEALSTWATDTGTTRALPADLPADLPVDLPVEVGEQLDVELVLALDGKTLKGARAFIASGFMTQRAVLEAVEHGSRRVHGMVEVLGGNENAAALVMIERIAARRGGRLDGVTITADAKHTTRELTARVTELGGDYVLTVKGNAPAAYAAIEALTWDDAALAILKAATNTAQNAAQNAAGAWEKAHGRKEHRTIQMMPLPSDLDTTLAGAVQAGRVHREALRRRTKTTPRAWAEEEVYIVTSLSTARADATRLARIVREHWGCEVLHWQRDMVFGEDRHLANTGHGPINLAILYNTALTRGNTRTTRIGVADLRARTRKPERALLALAS